MTELGEFAMYLALGATMVTAERMLSERARSLHPGLTEGSSD